MFKTKSFAIAILVFFFFLSFLLVQFSERTAKSFLAMFYQSITRKHVTKIGPSSLDTSKKVCTTNVFQDVFAICVIHVSSCALPIHGNQLSQQPKNYKNQKLKNKMEGDKEHSTIQDLKDRKIYLISRKVRRKLKEKLLKKINRLIHNVKVTLILLLKNLSHLKR